MYIFIFFNHLSSHVIECIFFLVFTGTPESDTVCKRCPEGFFSNETSSKAVCQKHTNCSALGFKTALKGNAVRDNICQENTDTSPQKCGIGVYPIKQSLKTYL